MKKVSILFAAFVFVIIIYVIWKVLCNNDTSVIELASFIVLSITLIILIWYANDTNTIAKITQERWVREGVLSTTYSMQLIGNKEEAGKTLFQMHNPSTLIVRAKVNCNFKVYGASVTPDPAYSGKETWVLFPQQISQGWFEIEKLLEKKGKTCKTMINERTYANSNEQLTMNLEIEFCDELGTKRTLPKRLHYLTLKVGLGYPN